MLALFILLAPRLVLDVELFTQARLTHQTGDDLSDVRLERGEVGAQIALGPEAFAELRLETIRSAADGGALGIDGDSTVERVKYAQLAGEHRLGRVRIEGAIGVVPDPWLRSIEDGYTVKPLSRTGTERLLQWPVSDVAGRAGASFGPARLVVSLGNGEGLRYPERNSGKTTTAVLELTPVETKSLRVVLRGVARDGSVGVASIRDQRFGGGASVFHARARGGFDIVAARGIGDRGEIEGTLVEGWAEAEPVSHVFAGARGATLGLDGATGRTSTWGGGVAVEPWPQVRFWLAAERVTSSGDAMPVPGTGAGNATLVMLIASARAPFVME